MFSLWLEPPHDFLYCTTTTVPVPSASTSVFHAFMLSPRRSTRAAALRVDTSPLRVQERITPRVGDVVDVFWEDREAYYRGTLKRRIAKKQNTFLVLYKDLDCYDVNFDNFEWKYADQKDVTEGEIVKDVNDSAVRSGNSTEDSETSSIARKGSSKLEHSHEQPSSELEEGDSLFSRKPPNPVNSKSLSFNSHQLSLCTNMQASGEKISLQTYPNSCDSTVDVHSVAPTSQTSSKSAASEGYMKSQVIASMGSTGLSQKSKNCKNEGQNEVIERVRRRKGTRAEGNNSCPRSASMTGAVVRKSIHKHDWRKRILKNVFSYSF